MAVDERVNNLEFLMERYSSLQEYRQRTLLLEEDSMPAEERRHENHVRNLVDAGDFDGAVAYLGDMAGWCEQIEDFAAAELYRSYRERVSALRDGNI